MSPSRHSRPIPSASASHAYCAGLVDIDTAAAASYPPSRGYALSTTFLFAFLLFILALVLMSPQIVYPAEGALIATGLTVAACVTWGSLTVNAWVAFRRDRAAHRAAVATVNDALARNAAAQVA